jgi:uncharacterized membrane protein
MAGSTGAALTADRTSPGALRQLLARLESSAPALLVLTIVLWVAVIFAASAYKYETFGQGYDQVDFEQAIWNTTQGRIMEDSRFNFTGSIFGMDWMPMLFFFVPFYALIPSAHTLFFLQIVGIAVGAVPVYWLARDRLGSKLAALGLAMVYLLYPTLLHTALNPFQVRVFAVTLLLFGFYFYEKRNWHLFMSCALLAMLARTDVALVVAMFGVYGLLTRRRWPYVIPPLVVGLGYFVLSISLIVPSFAYPGVLSGGTGAVGDDYMACWPCGTNPLVAYYGHLGRSGPEIVGYILTHPLQVAGIMLEKAKVEYMLSLLVPLALLPLLSPRPLVLGLPVLALNLLSLRTAQYDYKSHYSLLLVLGLVTASVYGLDNLVKWVARLRARLHPDQGVGDRPVAWVQWAALGLAAWALVMTIPFKNPVARVVLFHEPPARVQAAKELISMIPPEARVAASSKLAPRLLPRRYIYNFPPAPYSPYNFGPRRAPGYVELDYVLVDPEASALTERQNLLDGKSAFDWLRELPEWELVAAREGIYLYRHR